MTRWIFGMSVVFCALLAACANSRDAADNCGVGELACDGQCVNILVNGNHCGECGNVCPAGVSCGGGVCGGSVAVDAGPGADLGPAPDAAIVNMCSPTCSSDERCCGTECRPESVMLGTDGRSDLSFGSCGGCGQACDMQKASACSVAANASNPTCMCGTTLSCGGNRVCQFTSGAFRCVDPTTVTDGGTAADAGSIACGAGACRAASGSDLGQICCGGACVNVDNSNCGTCGNMCPSLFEADDLGIDPTILSALCITAGDFASIAACTADPLGYFISSFLGGGSSFGVGCGMGSSSIMGGGATSVCCQTAGICTDALSGGGGLPFP